MNWLPTTVGDACLLTAQTDPARSGAASFRYVDIGGVDRDVKAILRADVVPCLDAPSRARRIIRTSDVLDWFFSLTSKSCSSQCKIPFLLGTT